MKELNDTQIRANLRTVLAKHRIDMTTTAFVCTRGIVRLNGELEHQGAVSSVEMRTGELEAFEHDIQDVRGVQRVYFDLSNWRRLASGQWARVEKRSTRKATSEASSVISADL